MGDHFDFRGGVFNQPFVGKQVTQVTTVQSVQVARPDDKFYVVMKGWSLIGDDTQVTGPDKVAMSLDMANSYVLTRKGEDGYVSEGAEIQEDGTACHSFYDDDDHQVIWYWVESVDAV